MALSDGILVHWQNVQRRPWEMRVFFASTPIVPEEHPGKSNWEHQNEFFSVEQLRELLDQDFMEIKIDKTLYQVKDGGECCTAYFTLRGPK
jgi:hypothetical protein